MRHPRIGPSPINHYPLPITHPILICVHLRSSAVSNSVGNVREHPAMRHIAASAFLLFAAISAAAADAPALSYLFPPGARQGATVTVTLGSKDLPTDAKLWIEGDGISAAGSIKDGKISLVVAPDAAPGVR